MMPPYSHPASHHTPYTLQSTQNHHIINISVCLPMYILWMNEKVDPFQNNSNAIREMKDKKQGKHIKLTTKILLQNFLQI